MVQLWWPDQSSALLMTFQCWTVRYMSFAFLVYCSWNAIYCIQDIIKEEFYNWQRCIFFFQLVCKPCHCCDSLNMLICMQWIKDKWLNQLLPQSTCSATYQKSAGFAARVGNFYAEQLMYCHNSQSNGIWLAPCKTDPPLPSTLSHLACPRTSSSYTKLFWVWKQTM